LCHALNSFGVHGIKLGNGCNRSSSSVTKTSIIHALFQTFACVRGVRAVSDSCGSAWDIEPDIHVVNFDIKPRFTMLQRESRCGDAMPTQERNAATAQNTALRQK
jgi:hypothetical protein